MTTTLKWTTPESIGTALDSGLNSLGDGNTALSAAIDNLTDLYTLVDLELVLASVDLSAQTKLWISVWFITTVDGSNYEDGSAGTPGTVPSRPPDAVFPLRKVNAAQRINITNIPVPPYSGKLLLQNNAGAALASSGNTLKYRRHTQQGV